MISFGVFIAVIIMAAMVYAALSNKFNWNFRLAALIALGVMVLSVIVCLFLVFFQPAPPLDESIVLVTGPAPPPPKAEGTILVLLLFVIFLLGLFITVLIISFKDHRKNAVKKQTSSLFLDEELSDGN